MVGYPWGRDSCNRSGGNVDNFSDWLGSSLLLLDKTCGTILTRRVSLNSIGISSASNPSSLIWLAMHSGYIDCSEQMRAVR